MSIPWILPPSWGDKQREEIQKRAVMRNAKCHGIPAAGKGSNEGVPSGNLEGRVGYGQEERQDGERRRPYM